jgi:hypothetical protein
LNRKAVELEKIMGQWPDLLQQPAKKVRKEILQTVKRLRSESLELKKVVGL